MVFLNDELTHWAWVIPIFALLALQIIFFKNNDYQPLAIIFTVVSLIIFLVLGKLAKLLGPARKIDLITGKPTYEYTESHQNCYIFFIVFIIISLLLSCVSIKVGNKQVGS
jgi:hypothetical protein